MLPSSSITFSIIVLAYILSFRDTEMLYTFQFVFSAFEMSARGIYELYKVSVINGNSNAAFVS